ncbi:Hypothetical protein ETEE_1384 [Edwardsiella anguillarum ET080813]|uniref:Uncharacterized protein n=1 Tax=Edwardsiella anguillarum ET080813 TaxID=667120 RepID=A0A076LM51_9GAMM|nr:Hypothetical protein ETEE_1384 [Edwardsiella anguillarum ET080813]
MIIANSFCILANGVFNDKLLFCLFEKSFISLNTGITDTLKSIPEAILRTFYINKH